MFSGVSFLSSSYSQSASPTFHLHRTALPSVSIIQLARLSAYSTQPRTHPGFLLFSDLLMVTYLANLTQSQIALNEKLVNL